MMRALALLKTCCRGASDDDTPQGERHTHGKQPSAASLILKSPGRDKPSVDVPQRPQELDNSSSDLVEKPDVRLKKKRKKKAKKPIAAAEEERVAKQQVEDESLEAKKDMSVEEHKQLKPLRGILKNKGR